MAARFARRLRYGMPLLDDARDSGPQTAFSLLGDIPELIGPRTLRLEDVARSVLEAALAIVGGERGILLFQASERGRDLAPVAAVGLSVEAATMPPAASPLARVLDEALRAERPWLAERVGDRVDAGAAATAVAAPLRGWIREPWAQAFAGERRRVAQPPSIARRVGLLYVERDAARPFRREDLARLAALAEHAARALALARLRDAAAVDPLTGFLARAELEPCLAVEMTLAAHAGAPLGLVLVQVDAFDEISRERGRRFGDEVVRTVAARVRRELREGDLGFRSGPDKLALVLPSTDEAGTVAVAERVRRAAAAPGEPAIAASVGAAVFPAHADRRAELLKKADQALVIARQEGGDRVRAWHRGISRYALRSDKLAGILTGDPERDARNVLLLLDAIAVVNAIHERGPLLSAILDMMVELAGAERGAVFLPDPEEPARLGVALAQDATKRPIAFADYPEGVVAKVARTRLPVGLLDYLGEDDPAVEERVRELRLRRVVCIPLVVKETLAGVIYVDGRSAAGEMVEADLVFAQALARELGIAIENARLAEENERSRREVEDLNRKLARKLRKQAHELEEVRGVLEVELHTKYSYDKLIGKTPKMQEIYRLLDRITPTEVPVLIQGESGTGKELVARAIHYNGGRRRKRFVSVNCAALAPTLLESELFGHVKGAFTGADRDKPGLFEQADGGTLFVDEVQDMSPQLQRELLRVLQEKEVRRVGGKDVIPVDVRVIGATNRSLPDLMRRGLFREDLYYRLNVVAIELPPLRERKEDVPLLVERHLSDLCEATGRPPTALDRGAWRKLLRHDWPGNVRELHNVLERTLLLVDGDTIREEDLDLEGAPLSAVPSSQPAPAPPPGPEPAGPAPADALPAPSPALAPLFALAYKEAEDRFKAEYVRRLLARHGGNVTRAAESSGLLRSSLHKIMRKLEISPRDAREKGEGAA